ncbi:MAG: HAMP domain-containing histidine kinase [Clostridia bacterium]|nr:HAMP domain-containing histidine kinase [Clostridia bacterium]
MKRKGLGIRAKVFLEIGAIIAVCLVGISIANSQLLESVYIWNVERTLASMAQNTENAGADYFYMLAEYETKENVSIDLYDTQDRYLYEGSGNFISANKINIISRKQNEDGSYFNVVAEDGSTTQYIVFGKDFENGWHIEITAQKDPIKENANLATGVTTTITILALVLALVFISAYSKHFTKPLIQMSEVANKIANLDFSAKCEINRGDEIGALADNINVVSESLNSALSELREKNAQLMEDIEKERRIEKMRADFISAASHELKTPIAIIRGYAEGLKMNMGEEDEGASEYCDIIMRESDRMNALVLNMLEQSLYSSGVKKPDMTEFEVNPFIEDLLKTVNPIFEEKGVKASFIANNDFIAFADKAQMTTVLSNIVLNACSHARGEKLIEITTEKVDNKIKINIFNTGSRVEEVDKEGIFTSFYRADKAHSRAEGRFGLGLAIVKSITENHNCDCGFENKENGVTFWFTMPECTATERKTDEN